MMLLPSRGDIWLADLDPVRGREQAGRRPVLVISSSTFNHGPADLVVVIPLTSKDKGIPLHIRIDPPEGGLKQSSFAMCEALRSVSRGRLSAHWGRVTARSLTAVEQCLRTLLEL